MIQIDMENGWVSETTAAGEQRYPIGTAEAFSVISKAWLRSGWDNKYVYSFAWMGRPVIQLPEDMLRIQEVIYQVKPDVLIETGIAHGGSLILSASMLALLLGAGYLRVMPLKERVPFLVMADASSGNATVARLDEDFRHRSVSASEAIARANVAGFISLRESYDVAMMNLRDWRAVHAMSAPEVGKEYAALHAANNADSPFNTWGRSRAIRVRILSIQLLDGPDGAPGGATVRFQRSVYDKASGATRPLDSRIATLGFTYNLALRMDEPDRLENPLGFQVTSYRVDAETLNAAEAQ